MGCKGEKKKKNKHTNIFEMGTNQGVRLHLEWMFFKVHRTFPKGGIFLAASVFSKPSNMLAQLMKVCLPIKS